MVFPITGGTQSTGYEVDNSLRLNRDDSPYLSKTYRVKNGTKDMSIDIVFFQKK